MLFSNFSKIIQTTSRFRAALNLDLVEQDGKVGGAPEVPPGPPVSDATFRSFLNKVFNLEWEVGVDDVFL